jgi:SAM-dependent methyltransferase
MGGTGAANMATMLTSDAILVDVVWTPEHLAGYQREIASRTGPSGYYHRYTVKDQNGQLLETPGAHPCIGVLASLDRFGFPQDFSGRRVLDVGCNAGFYSIAAKLRGAASVLGVDYFDHCVRQATMMRDIVNVDVEFRQGDGEVISALEPFDVVINTGVIYHLQNPMQFLTNMARLTREFMFLETEMLLGRRFAEYAWFIEHEYGGDGSNWWIYGPECVVRMARAAGFSRAEFQGFVWKPPFRQRTREGFLRQGRGVIHCWK